jgi:hypothetical protein
VYRCFKRILYSDRDSLVTTLHRSVLPRIAATRQERVRLCDIGGGDGARLEHIVTRLHDMFDNEYEADFVEQSAIYAADFARRVKPPSLTARVHGALFEDVALPAASYDIVFLIHSIFAFANGAAIEKVLALPRCGGNAIVVSNAGDSFLAGLKRLVDADFNDARYEISDLALSLEVHGVTFSTQTFDTSWEITNQEWRGAASIILDWISLGRYETFEKRRKREIVEYLYDQSTPTRAGRAFHETEVVLVLSPKSVS